MLDHIGFIVSDYGRAKEFYQKALAPLGYHIIMEVTKEMSGGAYEGAGFGEERKPTFWIGGGGPALPPRLHGAFVIDLDGHNVEAVCHAPA